MFVFVCLLCVGCWLSLVDCRSPFVVGCWLLVVARCWLVIGCLLFVAARCALCVFIDMC